MTELQFDSPLKWPHHVAPTETLRRGINHQFSAGMTEEQAVAYLQDEITQTHQITSAKLTCNAMNIVSPMPTQYISKQPGASVLLKIEGQSFNICCDKWQTLAHNIYALHLAIRQFRQLESWGVGSMSLILNGFKDGAASATSAMSGVNVATHSWMQTLGLGAGASLDDANAIYRARAKTLADDPDALQALNLAIAAARKHFGNAA